MASYLSGKDIEERIQRIEAEFSQIEKREDQKAQTLTLPIDLWLNSGLEEGGILIIAQDERLAHADELRRRGYKVRVAKNEQEAMTAFQKASYSLMVVPWVIFEKSSDLVRLLRKAFPQTRLIITSPNFAWSNESIAGANLGKEALSAGAYSYIPERHISETVLTCVESAMRSIERACPVLMSGLPCNLRCAI